MANRSLSIQLDLDAGKFTATLKQAQTGVKGLAGEVAAATTVISKAEGDVKDLTTIVTKMNAAMDGAVSKTSQLKAAQASFTQSIRDEIDALKAKTDALGKTNAQLLEAEARSLKMVGATRAMRAELEAAQKAYTDKAEAIRQVELAEKAEAETQARLEASIRATTEENEKFVDSLRRQLETMGMSEEQLLAYEAAERGLTAETRDLILALEEKRRSLEMVAEQEIAEARAANEAAIAQERAARAALAEAEAKARQISPQQAFINSLQRQVTQQKEALIQAQGGAKALAEFRAAEVGATEAAAPLIAELARLDAEFKKVQGSAHGAMGGITREIAVMTHEGVSHRFNQMAGSFSILMSRLGMAGGAAIGVTVLIGVLHSLIGPVYEAAKGMEELAHASEETGLAIPYLQQLGIAADLTGTKFEKLVSAAARLDMNFARARGGAKQPEDGFKAVGVDTSKDYPSEELMNKVVEGFSKIDSGARKTAVAMELFGRSGKDLIPVLKALSDQKEEIDRMADDYAIKNQKAVEVGVQLAGAQRETGVAMKGLSEVFLQVFGPALNSITQMMNGMIKSFIQSYQHGGTARIVMQGLAVTFKALIEIVVGVGQVIYDLTELVLGLTEVAVGLVVKAITPMTSAILEVGGILNWFGTMAKDAFTLDWSGLADEWTHGLARVNDVVRKAAEQQQSFGDSLLKGGGAGVVNSGTDFIDQATGWGKFWDDKQDHKYNALPSLGNTSTEGDEPGKPKTDKAQNLAEELKQKLAELNATLDDGDKTLAKYTEALNDPKSSLSKLVDAHAGLRKEIQGLLADIAKADAEIKSKKSFDKLKEDWTKASDEGKALDATLAELMQGMGHVDVEAAKYGAELRRLAADSKVFTDAHSKALDGKSLEEWVKQTEAAKEHVNAVNKAIEGYQSLKKELDDTQRKSGQVWDDIAAGLIKVDTHLESVIRKQREYIASLQAAGASPAFVQEETSRSAQLVVATAQGDAGEAVQGMQKETRKLEADNAGSADDKARQAAQDDIDGWKQRIQWALLTQKQWDLAYGDLNRLIDQTNQHLANESGFGKMAKEWGDAIGTIKKDSEGWINQLTDGLLKGRMNWKTFAQGVTQDLQKMAIHKALSGGMQWLANATTGKVKVGDVAHPGKDLDKTAKALLGDDKKDKTIEAKTLTVETANFTNVKGLSGGTGAPGTPGASDNPNQVTNPYADVQAGPISTPDLSTELPNLANFSGGGSGGFMGMLQGLMGGGSGGGIMGMLQGLMGGSGGGGLMSMLPTLMSFFHGGGIAGGKPTFARNIAIDVSSLPKFHTGGVIGLKRDEVPAVLQKGEGVFTREQMDAMGSARATPNVGVNIINQSGTNLDAQQQGQGRFQATDYIVDVVVAAAGQPGKMRDALKAFGRAG